MLLAFHEYPLLLPKNLERSEFVNYFLLKEIGSTSTHNHDRLTGIILYLPLKQENWKNIWNSLVRHCRTNKQCKTMIPERRRETNETATISLVFCWETLSTLQHMVWKAKQNTVVLLSWRYRDWHAGRQAAGICKADYSRESSSHMKKELKNFCIGLPLSF